VGHRHPDARDFARDLVRDTRHLGGRHPDVRLVVELHDRPTLRVVADDPEKHAHWGPSAWGFEYGASTNVATARP
jgi:hypothetical protein